MERILFALDLLWQKTRESHRLQEISLSALACLGSALILFRKKNTAWTVLSQVHRSTRSTKLRSLVEPWLIRNRYLTFIKTDTTNYASELTQALGWRLMVLKPPISPSEKGVLLIKFSELLHKVAVTFDVKKLLRDYTLLIEPSWSGYCDRDFIYFSQFSDPIFIETPDSSDFDFLSRLNSNLIPLRAGSGDWVDPEIAAPYLSLPKIYDLVMNAHWGRWKRHHVLFNAIKDMDIKVALIGFAWDGRTIKDIKKLAEYYHVLDKLEIFDRIPFTEVMRINAQSRFSILLSRKEGANRSIPEAMFADTPAIVLRETIGGVTKNVSSRSGWVCQEKELREVISAVMRGTRTDFSARQWAIEHISYIKSTDYINRCLMERAIADGNQWTMNIAPRKNSPELTYANPEDPGIFHSHNAALTQYFKDQRTVR